MAFETYSEESKFYSELDPYFDCIRSSLDEIYDGLIIIQNLKKEPDNELLIMKEKVFASDCEEKMYLKDVYTPKMNDIYIRLLALFQSVSDNIKREFVKSLKVVFKTSNVRNNTPDEKPYVAYLEYAKKNLDVDIDENLYNSLYILFDLDYNELSLSEDLYKVCCDCKEIIDEVMTLTTVFLKDSCDKLYD